ncbi:T9SS type A sorting domain-containing protein [bacterium]|nr:T9SS type A sorting domain-containing protein [bacterium]
MKKMIIISFIVFSVISARQLMVNTHEVLSTKAAHSLNKNVKTQINMENNFGSSTRTEITLFEWDFEGDSWNGDDGWELTESNSHSPSHSHLSPNTEVTLNSVWNLTSDVISLPELGNDEIMRFKFWLLGDTPDTDGNGDDFLDDYYSVSIIDLDATPWHVSQNGPNQTDGEGYWCADEEVGPSGGYLDSWLQFLDTPSISIPSDGNAVLNANLKFEIEDEAGADGAIDGSCTNGWDAANVRISTDGGQTWNLLEDPNNPYDFSCGYGWIWNDGEYDTRGALNHLAPGWGGSSASGLSNGWFDFNADLSTYAGEDVIIRFAFGSDAAYSTIDESGLTGFQVDGINIVDNNGGVDLYNDDCDESADAETMTTPANGVTVDQFYDYCDTTRPGGNGEWELYEPGLAFNGNALHDISDFAGKNIKFRVSSRYDADDDGGSGAGLFIDDFTIYKESSASYPAPSGLTAEGGSEQVELNWGDMNASASFEDIIYDNDSFDNGISMVQDDAVGFAGVSYSFGAGSTIHSVDIYELADDSYCSDTDYSEQFDCENNGGEWITSDQVDFDMDICVFGAIGSLYNTDPTYDCITVNTSSWVDGWNTVTIPDWEMTGTYIIAHTFNSGYAAALDETASGEHSYFSYLQNTGSTASWDGELSSDGSFEGEWGLRANVSYEGADVTYNAYRDGLSIASGLTNNSYVDTDVMNDVEYTYNVTATYSDGTESGFSYPASARPEPASNHEESWDDGQLDAYFETGNGSLAMVRYNAVEDGEILKRFKWYSYGEGGAFQIKVYSDVDGLPGEQIGSFTQVDIQNGWNERDLSSSPLTVSGDFWIGVKSFSSTQPFGADLTEPSGNSIYLCPEEDENGDCSSNGEGEWETLEFDLMFRVVLDCQDNCPGDDPCSDTLIGDTNGDTILNVLDVVTLVQFILGQNELEGCAIGASDFNQDGTVNVLDVVGLVQYILSPRSADATSAVMDILSDGVSLKADGYIGAVQMTLSHDPGFVLSLTDDALVSEYKTEETTTTLIVVMPEDDQLFTTSDTFKVDEVLVANSESFITVTESELEFSLSSAYPNPFNPTTTIEFSASEAGYASVKIYNLMGQVVGVLMDGMVDAKTYNLTWNAKDLSSGVYMIKAESNGNVATQKVMLLK